MKSIAAGEFAELVFNLDEGGRPIERIGGLKKRSYLQPYHQMTFIIQSHDDIDT
jgi:hypothetical protein